MPRFSIVVPAYNAEATLAETLDAVCAQTHADWECVVVDDGSMDGTAAMVRSYAERDERFRLFQQENRGTGGAYNTGVRAAAGEWICICSADDLLLPEHLTAMSDAIDRHPESDILSCNGFFLNLDGTRETVYTGPAAENERSWSIDEVLAACFFSVGACYRAILFESLGGYTEENFGEDYDFWLRAMAGGARHLYVPRVLSVHRRSATQKSANLAKAYQSDIETIEALLGSDRLDAGQTAAARSAIRHRRRLLLETRPLVSAVIRSLRRIHDAAGGAPQR